LFGGQKRVKSNTEVSGVFFFSLSLIGVDAWVVILRWLRALLEGFEMKITVMFSLKMKVGNETS
jgi:hypothetical protein